MISTFFGLLATSRANASGITTTPSPPSYSLRYTNGTASRDGDLLLADLANGGRNYNSIKFTVAENITVTKASVLIYREGSPVSSLSVKIYTDNAGQPGTLVGTGSESIAASSISTAATRGDAVFVDFAGTLSAALTAGTYHLVVVADQYVGSGALKWVYTFDAGNGVTYESGNGTAWNNYNNNMALNFKLYSSP